ncbi:MAG: flagellar biosynthetic protein FliO [Syntrophales bacterium]|nr:flagellar biosynthetic protein FliO [Syntrophales bacterium]
MLLALGLVIALMLASVYFLKRMLGRTSAGYGGEEVIKILAARALGPRTSIIVVDTLGKVTVIGLSAGSMQVIATIDDEARLEKLRQMKERPPVSYSPLWTKLKKKMGSV